jgi:acyl-coenzyme A thioesterase PaaI-like protein
MAERSGAFWEAMQGRAPMPNAAATLGLEFIDFDAGTCPVDLAFTPTEAFTNPTGNVLGAFVAAMLYDTVGPALLATLRPDQFQSTLPRGPGIRRRRCRC